MLFSEKNNTKNKSRSGKKTLEKTGEQSRINNPMTLSILGTEDKQNTKD